MSATDILLNSPALHSLKRNQLLSLCKTHGIKATGKNTELIEKLQAYAQSTHKQRQDASMPDLAKALVGSSESTAGAHEEENEEDKRTKMRPSELWEIIEEETMQEMKALEDEHKGSTGSKQSSFNRSTKDTVSNKSMLKMPGEFGGSTTTSKGSTVSSTMKSLASTFKWGSKSNLNASTSRAQLEEPAAAQMDIDPSEPEPTEGLHLDNDMADVSIELHQTIRLVNGPPRITNPPTPNLRAFRPSCPLAPLSPGNVPKMYPPIPTQFAGDSPIRRSPLIRHLASPALAAPSTPTSVRKQPFVFGSPEAVTGVSNVQFNVAANSILDEMNRRLGVNGVATVSNALLDGRELGKAQETLEAAEQVRKELAQNRPMKKVPKRFSDAHQKEFGKMESIIDYAARRDMTSTNAVESLSAAKLGGKRKSSVLGSSEPAKRRGGMPGGFFGNGDAAEEDHRQPPKPKRARMSTVDGASDAFEHSDGMANKLKIEVPEANKDAEQAERDREAVKRKLELARARRRSSRGRPSAGGRPSVGRGAAATQAKKSGYSRFGFFKSAVGTIKGVWNRGTTAAAEPVKQAAQGKGAKPSVVTQGQYKVNAASAGNDNNKMSRKVSSENSSTLNSTARSRGAIPSFKPSANRRKSRGSIGVGTGHRASSRLSSKEKVPQVSSIGIKKASVGVPSATGNSTGQRSRFSTLMAPTASSLAKRQSSGKANNENANPNSALPFGGQRSLSFVQDSFPPVLPQKRPGITNSQDRVVLGARHDVKIPSVTFAAPVEPVKADAIVESTVKEGSLRRKPSVPARRPRISRTNIVAKLQARRIASDSSGRSSASGRSRRSFGGSKAAAGISRHSGLGVSNPAIRKRIRASEFARRKSRAPSLNAGGGTNAMDISP